MRSRFGKEEAQIESLVIGCLFGCTGRRKLEGEKIQSEVTLERFPRRRILNLRRTSKYETVVSKCCDIR